MYQKVIGIVLHSLKYNDTSNIVHVYTRENGRVSFLVKIPKSRKTGVRPILFQPLAMVELEVDFRTNASIHSIKEAKTAYHFK